MFRGMTSVNNVEINKKTGTRKCDYLFSFVTFKTSDSLSTLQSGKCLVRMKARRKEWYRTTEVVDLLSHHEVQGSQWIP